MPNRVRVLTVPDNDRAELERRAWDRAAPARVAERTRIVQLAADGLTGPQIAERVGGTERTVIKWRRQYAGAGLAGPEDTPPGRAADGAAKAGGSSSPNPASWSGTTPACRARPLRFAHPHHAPPHGRVRE
jgi:hypothetical protein